MKDTDNTIKELSERIEKLENRTEKMKEAIFKLYGIIVMHDRKIMKLSYKEDDTIIDDIMDTLGL